MGFSAIQVTHPSNRAIAMNPLPRKSDENTLDSRESSYEGDDSQDPSDASQKPSESLSSTQPNYDTYQRMRKEKRLAMNRETARARRKRKKDLLESLGAKVTELSQQNIQLRSTAQSLRNRNQQLEQELQALKSSHRNQSVHTATPVSGLTTTTNGHSMLQGANRLEGGIFPAASRPSMHTTPWTLPPKNNNQALHPPMGNQSSAFLPRINQDLQELMQFSQLQYLLSGGSIAKTTGSNAFESRAPSYNTATTNHPPMSQQLQQCLTTNTNDASNAALLQGLLKHLQTEQQRNQALGSMSHPSNS